MKLFAIVVLILTSISCTKKQSSEYGLNMKETFQLHLQAEPPTLDWTKATDLTSATILVNLMEGLIDYDFSGEKPQLIPALAESWSSNKEATEWTFKIKKDVVWNDGTPLTGQHFLDALHRLVDPATGSGLAYIMYSVKNAEAFNKGKIKDKSKLGFELMDDYTLKISLARPVVFFPMYLTYTATFPVRLDIINKYEHQWTNSTNIVTLGPYYLKSWQHDKDLILARNSGW